MKLNNQQAMLLYDIAKDTLDERKVLGGMRPESRKVLCEQIMDQQDLTIKRLSDE